MHTTPINCSAYLAASTQRIQTPAPAPAPALDYLSLLLIGRTKTTLHNQRIPKLDITTVRHMSQFTVNVWYLHLAQHKKTTKQQQPAPLRGGKSGPPLRGWWPG
eukprot:scaffold147120_cov73-Cyclotella_meneghiniana.AAC.1